jgi:hypothetical protein
MMIGRALQTKRTNEFVCPTIPEGKQDEPGTARQNGTDEKRAPGTGPATGAGTKGNARRTAAARKRTGTETKVTTRGTAAAGSTAGTRTKAAPAGARAGGSKPATEIGNLERGTEGKIAERHHFSDVYTTLSKHKLLQYNQYHLSYPGAASQELIWSDTQ